MTSVCPSRACDRLSVRSLAGAALSVMLAATAPAATHPDGSAYSLRTSYWTLQSEIERNAFGRPLHLESTETPDTLAGDIHAVVDFPFATVSAALGESGNWCEILMLHPNVEQCRASESSRGGDAAISIDLGRALLPMTLSYRLVSAGPDYLHLKLAADRGPIGTTDYRIELEAAPLDAQRSIVHLTFSHGYGTSARLAMQAYLATLGRSKVGFTRIGSERDGRARYVRDLRGALERNAMRYYLAIEAYLGSLSASPGERREARLEAWYASTQRYARQLHEDAEYLDIKRRQLAKQPMLS